jgi:dTDP-4-dehydrorhamnose 3,5-epimerase
MRFQPTKLPGVFILDPELHEDSRGFFTRTFCAREFAAQGLVSNFVQSSVSFNHKCGTLRGLHLQLSPACETKLVRCTAGMLYDVLVDLRPDSPTYLQHLGVELSAENRRSVYVPEMVAHGFQTLTDDTEVFYQISAFYALEKSTGLRYDDPKLDIRWPQSVAVISEKDARWPLLK